jgi:hypothetical protein
MRKVEGESFGAKTTYRKKSALREELIAWRVSWATVANSHFKRIGSATRLDMPSCLGNDKKRVHYVPRSTRPRVKWALLKKLRARQPPLPPSPLVRVAKTNAAGGSIILRSVITGSALNKINTDPKPLAPPSKTSRSNGWPPEAIADWTSWGQKQPARFFAKWPELGGQAAAGLSR